MYIRLSKKNIKVKLCKAGRVRHKHICLECKEEFISCRTTAKYCSNKCRQKHYRDENWYELYKTRNFIVTILILY